jgi:hypothetical protein
MSADRYLTWLGSNGSGVESVSASSLSRRCPSDRGRTPGKGTGERRQFAALFEDASRYRFDCVLFWALDRFSREGMVPTIHKWALSKARPRRDAAVSSLTNGLSCERVTTARSVGRGFKSRAWKFRPRRRARHLPAVRGADVALPHPKTWPMPGAPGADL